MLTESSTAREQRYTRAPIGFKVMAALTAIAITFLFFLGYTYLRSRHVQPTTVTRATEVPKEPVVPSGPPQVNIVVDEAMLKGGEITLGGAVKNISDAPVTNISVELELYPREGKNIEQALIKLEPATLEPQHEGRYELKVKAKDYSYARVLGLRAGDDSTLIAYTSSPGKKRPPERIEGEMVPAHRSRGGDEFLNTPDNPARVP